MLKNLSLLTCTPKQAAQLLGLGINPDCFLWHKLTGPADDVRWKVLQLVNPLIEQETVPAWTKHEIDVMIGPSYAKADLWPEEKAREKAATDLNSFPVFFLDRCTVFKNGAQASAHGLIWLLQNEFINPADANNRYREIFLK